MNTLEKNLLGLTHSSLDIDNLNLHKFFEQLNSNEFTKQTAKQKSEKLHLLHPFKVHDFSQDSKNNYSGYGLKSITKIPKGEVILKMDVTMGLVSNQFAHSDKHEQEDDGIHDQILRNTAEAARIAVPDDSMAVQRNRVE